MLQYSIAKGNNMRNDTWITVAIWKATRPIIKALQAKQKKESPTKKDFESLGTIVHKGVSMYAESQNVKVK
jgi:hypothetical protein